MTGRTAPIKFTAATVREVAARVKAFTGGHFALDDVGSDQGRGVRYADLHKEHTWYGAEGARQACAYYIGGALETARTEGRMISDDDTAYLMRVQAAYREGTQRRKDSMQHWEGLGRERARQRADAGA